MSLYVNLLQLVPECAQLKETQMAYLLNNESTKAYQARQKILFFVLQQLDSIKITDASLGKSLLEKKMEVPKN
jgi:hypothetical protein